MNFITGDNMEKELKKRITEYINKVSQFQGPYEIIESNEAKIYAFTEYIVKVHRKENNHKKFFENERFLYNLLKKIDPNLIPNFEINEDLQIIKTEKYEYDLQEKITEIGYIQDIFSIRYIFKQIVDKLYILHSNNIFHGDLKLENIVIKGDYLDEDFGDFELKFIDFSFSNQLPNKTDTLICSRGTPNYAAPEIGTNLKINPFAADIWSLGACFHILISGNFLYDNKEYYKKLINKKYDFYSVINYYRNKEEKLNYKLIKLFEELIYGCCNIDPTKRWNIVEVKNFVDIELNYVCNDEEWYQKCEEENKIYSIPYNIIKKEV